MPYNPNNVPNSPLPISMLPAASTITNIMAQEFKIKGLVHSAVSADNLVIK